MRTPEEIARAAQIAQQNRANALFALWENAELDALATYMGKPRKVRDAKLVGELVSLAKVERQRRREVETERELERRATVLEFGATLPGGRL